MRAQRLLIAYAGILALGFAVPAHAAGYRMPVSFPGYTNRTENLTNFPVLVVLSNNAGAVQSHEHDRRRQV